MSKKCSNCGAPAPDDNAVFCNRCGAQLPAALLPHILTCRQCGKTFADRQSRFCNRCGSPLAPVVTADSPAKPAAKGKNCPACGFENFGENRFYCKKCGVYILKNDPILRSEPAGKAQKGRPKDMVIRIKPDGMDAVRQKPVEEPVEEQERPRVQREAVPQELPRVHREAVLQKREWASYRRVAFGAAGVLVLVLVIAGIAISVPAILNIGAANSTAPGLLEGIPWGIMPNQTPVINHSTPVVTDTPLTPEVF